MHSIEEENEEGLICVFYVSPQCFHVSLAITVNENFCQNHEEFLCSIEIHVETTDRKEDDLVEYVYVFVVVSSKWKQKLNKENYKWICVGGDAMK